MANAARNMGEVAIVSALDTQDLLPPRVQQTTADRVLARHGCRRRSRIQALQNNLALLLGRPNPPALTTRDQLDTRSARALTTYRMSVLILRRRQRCRIHDTTSITATSRAAMCPSRSAYTSP